MRAFVVSEDFATRKQEMWINDEDCFLVEIRWNFKVSKKLKGIN